ncbi:UNKNOWN [Stylonychia lemnae]|uniref:Uncharacterized protein n=1 Tax=Stylonychia lemnae TaxID=5949 RepID=A0A078A7M8_STYLE|nr:UNKNOWN [Stylonychia lemnae]|eukprot:CDW77866.1 UNKNOWN [Stylonychia lemnae]
MIENLQFELKVEQAKVDKIRKEWSIKKQDYVNQISQLSKSNQQKSEVLSKLENELKDMRDKVQYFYQNYQIKDKQCGELNILSKECKADKFKIEVEYAREKERFAKLEEEYDILQSSNEQLCDQIRQYSEQILKIENQKQIVINQKKKEWDKLRDFLTIITSESTKNNNVQQKEATKNIVILVGRAIEQIYQLSQKRVQQDFDLMEQRLKLTQQNMRKLKMEFQKINSERVFYKQIYKKRIVNESTIQDSVQKSQIVDKLTMSLSQSQLRPIRNNSIQKKNLYQEVLIKQNKDVSDILGLVEDKRQGLINHLQISPIKMFNLEKEMSKRDNNMNFEDLNNSDSENNCQVLSEIDTFRSKDVDVALEKAQQLMKFKHDREFINKVLDAQIRVNEIEQNILKNATSLSNSKKSVSKSSAKKPIKDAKQTKYDYGAMAASRPIRN